MKAKSVGQLHLIKLSVGSESVESLAEWQSGRLAQNGRLWHGTRMHPRRETELEGGSIYWVIKGLIQARQELAGLERVQDGQGRPMTLLLLEPELIRVYPTPQRAFQGWRYLTPEKAPLDLDRSSGGGEDLPPRLLGELRELGIL